MGRARRALRVAQAAAYGGGVGVAGLGTIGALGYGLLPLDRRDAPEERVPLRLIDRDARVDVPALVDDGRLCAAGFIDDDAQPRRGQVSG